MVKCMRNPDNFRFKQFEIRQTCSAMKVGTDSVILGTWCSVGVHDIRVLDVGTGTGILALMLAQRIERDGYLAHIDAIEIDSQAAIEASDNVARSQWSDRISVHHASLQEFAASFTCSSNCTPPHSDADGGPCNNGVKYDVIISNPPFFIASSVCPHAARAAARHAETLSYDDLADGVQALLAEHGRFVAIFPTREAEIFIAKAELRGLFCNRRLDIRPMPGRPIKRVVVEFSRTKCSCVVTDELVIASGIDAPYTEQYVELTRDFYLRH